MEKQVLYEIIEENAPEIIELSDKIWDFSELSMEEYKSAEYYCDLLEQEGFTVERQLCGIPTAFSGSFGSGSPRIGILGEFDALSGLSQVGASARRECLTEGGNGQGCGHNLLGVACLGGALGMNDKGSAGMVANLANNIAMFNIFGEMNEKGKLLNVAFAVGASFVFGDHLGFVAGVNQQMIFPMIIGKVVAGVTALILCSWLSPKLLLKIQDSKRGGKN